ncbi:MAG: hypothetical protein A2341_09140 [Deltaproteobacteria bacterium RIFOXYB12_FULL_58_9]|nr:MAG: hypothetical protein A2341_09140 [Deltaproteobacteria bacterium RIFOXYB12_FULL_58_9]
MNQTPFMLVLTLLGAVPASTPLVAPANPAARVRQVRPPRVPLGIAACDHVIVPTGQLSRASGETLRYLVDVDGLSVGTIDFKIERRGNYDGEPTTDYRSLFELDALVAAFVPVRGRAASMVPDSGFWPTVAMSDYNLQGNVYEEEMLFGADGNTLVSKRKKNGKLNEQRRRFSQPVFDFVSGFYAMRAMPVDMRGCSILFGNQRAYTIWVEPDGEEEVSTPAGPRAAHRYRIRFASEKSKRPYDATLWVGINNRVPYQAEILGTSRLVARIHMYETGI